MGKTSGDRKRHMRVLLLAVLLSATSPIGESGGESRSGNVCLQRRHSTSVLVDCPGKGALPAIGDSINGLALTHCAVVGSD